MTLQQLHQRIGRVQRAAGNIERSLIRADRSADLCGHPDQAEHARLARHLRGNLRELFTELHQLEARLPTPELLSAREYNRMLALGMTIEAAEAGRVQAYRQAAHDQRYQRAA
jgi:hypothetical protein